MVMNEIFRSPLEMSAERAGVPNVRIVHVGVGSEAKQTAALAKRSRITGGAIRPLEAELR